MADRDDLRRMAAVALVRSAWSFRASANRALLVGDRASDDVRVGGEANKPPPGDTTVGDSGLTKPTDSVNAPSTLLRRVRRPAPLLGDARPPDAGPAPEPAPAPAPGPELAWPAVEECLRRAGDVAGDRGWRYAENNAVSCDVLDCSNRASDALDCLAFSMRWRNWWTTAAPLYIARASGERGGGGGGGEVSVSAVEWDTQRHRDTETQKTNHHLAAIRFHSWDQVRHGKLVHGSRQCRHLRVTDTSRRLQVTATVHAHADFLHGLGKVMQVDGPVQGALGPSHRPGAEPRGAAGFGAQPHLQEQLFKFQHRYATVATVRGGTSRRGGRRRRHGPRRGCGSCSCRRR